MRKVIILGPFMEGAYAGPQGGTRTITEQLDAAAKAELSTLPAGAEVTNIIPSLAIGSSEPGYLETQAIFAVTVEWMEG